MKEKISSFLRWYDKNLLGIAGLVGGVTLFLRWEIALVAAAIWLGVMFSMFLISLNSQKGVDDTDLIGRTATTIFVILCLILPWIA